MALVLSTGVVTTSLSEYIADLGVRWQQRSAPDLSLDVETPPGPADLRPVPPVH